MTHTMNIIPNHDHGVSLETASLKVKSESNDATTTIHQAVSQFYSSLDSCNKYVLIGVASSSWVSTFGCELSCPLLWLHHHH